MGLKFILEFSKPANEVPRTVWSSQSPLNLKPRLVTLLFLVSGLWIFGTGEVLLIDAGIGVSPWTVLAEGMSVRTDFTIGMATLVISILVLVLWIPLQEIPGIGTILNAILVAVSIDVMAPFIPDQTGLVPAIIQSSIGILLVGIGSALYLTANLGPGPRDGWMTGIQKKTDWPIAWVRMGIEILVLGIGIALGGTFGLGTIMFALGVGPAVALFLGVLRRWEI